MGFAPYNDPQIAVVVFVQRGSGGNDASPAAAKILDYYFNGPRLGSTGGSAVMIYSRAARHFDYLLLAIAAGLVAYGGHSDLQRPARAPTRTG